MGSPESILGQDKTAGQHLHTSSKENISHASCAVSHKPWTYERVDRYKSDYLPRLKPDAALRPHLQAPGLRSSNNHIFRILASCATQHYSVLADMTS